MDEVLLDRPAVGLARLTLNRPTARNVRGLAMAAQAEGTDSCERGTVSHCARRPSLYEQRRR